MHDLVIRNGTVVDGTGEPAFEGDLALDGQRIAAVGTVSGSGREEIDAQGHIVAPGWVDIHTHYDGQATWDPILAPSSWNGVTTLVMGNCGVGFAPVRPGEQDFLIELMEGVEDIPGTALHEGIDFVWESFGEYLDALDGMERVLDIAAQVPHCAVRAYVLGDRAHEVDVTDDELAAMVAATREGLEAGAVGFSSSRTILHSSKHGLVPGTYSHPHEMLALGRVLGEVGHGVFEMVSDGAFGQEQELEWMRLFCKETGRPLTFALAQLPGAPTAYRDTLSRAEMWSTEGARIAPQIPCRPTGMLFGLQSTIHPFVSHPTYVKMAEAPLEERVHRLRDPAVREQLLSEKPMLANPMALAMLMNWSQIYRLGDPPDYEPEASASVAAAAQREGRPPEVVALDWMLENEGRGFMFAPLANYVDGDFEAIREMMLHPSSVLGLSDGGAHCGLICDASMPSYLVKHWVRDRHRGERLPIEQVVRMQTRNTAELYGFNDRGTLEVGKKADVNVIDLGALHLHVPEMIHDLPAGGRRLTQRVDGYRYTVCSGVVTWQDGEPTGAMPGKLVRGGRSAG